MSTQPDTGALKVRIWNSIPVRLGLGVLVLTLLAATLALVILARREAQQDMKQDTDRARDAAAIIGPDLASRMLAGGGSDVWSDVSLIAAQNAGAIDAVRILVVDKAGVVKAGSEGASVGRRIAMADNPECPGCGSTREEDFPAAATFRSAQGANTLRIVTQLPVSLACMECHHSVESARSYVLIDFDLAPMELANRQREVAILGTGLVASVALAILIIFLFRHMVMRPANLLIAGMARLAGGDLSARTPVLAKNEIGLLADHFNHMAGQIEDQVARIDSAHTESALLYTLVVEASKTLEINEFATGVCRVINDKLAPRHTAFFLEPANSGWICAISGPEQKDVLSKGDDRLDKVLLSGAAHVQQLLNGIPPRLFMDACRTQALQLARDDAGLTLALPVVANAHLIGLLACAGIGTKIRIEEDLLKNLGAHLTLAAVNSRNYTGAITDGLTNLRNKQYGLGRLEDAVLAAQRYQSTLAVAMCDIDHFKRVNDTYGHPAGDAVLREISRRIAVCLRRADIAVRYGGEEFMLILPEANGYSLAAIGEKIRNAVEVAPVGLGAAGGDLQLTVSVGIAAFHRDADSGASLLDRADRMLYRAKEGGRNRVEVDL